MQLPHQREDAFKLSENGALKRYSILIHIIRKKKQFTDEVSRNQATFRQRQTDQVKN